MQRSKKIKEPTPEEYTTLVEAAEFWDKHEFDRLLEIYRSLDSRSYGDSVVTSTI